MKAFDSNSVFLFVMSGIIILFVVSQSIFFLVKAWKRAKELGIDNKTLTRVVKGSAVFTVAPAISG